MSTRIVLADDHLLFARALRSLLEKQTDLEVVAEVRDGNEALDVCRETRPDLVLMDISMPGLNGIETTRRLIAERPATKVLCLSMHAERRFVGAAFEAGARGYLLKDCDHAELTRALRAVLAGQIYVAPSVGAAVVEDCKAGRTASGGSALSVLSGREREVLQLLAEGHSTRVIAERLCISVKTIGTHREHIMDRLGIDNIAGLTKYAIREGLTTLD